MTSDKDFDLNELKSAMEQATPRPDAAKRAADIALATRAFADLHDARQGQPAEPRPTETTPAKGLFSGVIDMFMNLGAKGGLTATTALFAGGFLVFTPQGQSLWQRGPVMERTVEQELGTAVPDIDFGQGTAAPAPVPQTREIIEELSSDARTEPLDPPMVEMSADDSSRDVEGILTRGLVSGAQGNLLSPDLTGTPSQTEALTSAGDSEVPSVQGYSDRAVVDQTLSSTGSEAFPYSEEPVENRVEQDTETFANEEASPVRITIEEPVSTFSIDVDTASYAVIRQSLNAGTLPPANAVRIEEMINYFPYDYTAPDRDGSRPFAPNITVMQTPWNEHTRLVHIGLQGIEPASTDRQPLNLVFLIDTSGSMNDPAKLPLLRTSFLLMLDQLRPEDEVAIVTYAGSAGLALPATPASDRAAISAALANLTAGGSTNGQGGLEQAYDVAEAMMTDGEVSRVILATDGDFNVGLSDPAGLEDFIARQRDSGVYLSVLGFGRGNLDDATMQALAQNGNGIAAYIDTLNEAQKVLVDQLTGALFAIAEDVKVQVEWNPGVIAEYRLIGYETRALARQDFNNDAVDAGELGAGHSVTAIYEVTPVGSPALLHDPLRYQPQVLTTASSELGFLRLRWKAPGETVSQLYEVPITETGEGTGTEAQFAAAIAGFGQLLRGSDSLGDWGWDEAIALANSGAATDPFGYRREAVQLMRLAQSLSQN